MWIRGVKAVDNCVDNCVDNSRLWITSGLSTFLPQEIASCPQFHPQVYRALLVIDKQDPEFIHTIHRPYYYY